MDATYDILGIGNAIVDVLAALDDQFISRYDMQKGAMSLIDAQRADMLTLAMPDGLLTSGGSVANSCAVAAGLGARVAFLGCVAADALGQAFRDDITRVGVHFPSRNAITGPGTARCLIAVTPDGQRTMNTYLGACVGFSPDDVDEALIAQTKVIYLEGYLFDPPAAQAAFRVAADAARKAGRKVALSLSDAFCVDRHRAAFQDMIRSHSDILFANDAELRALYQENDLQAAIAKLRNDVDLAAITLGAEGSIVVQGNQTFEVPAFATRVVDTTGAGDAYAAGFLTALTRGDDLAACGRLGCAMAAEVIAQLGARPAPAKAAEIFARVRSAGASSARMQETIV